jgi:hypothetical protein
VLDFMASIRAALADGSFAELLGRQPARGMQNSPAGSAA